MSRALLDVGRQGAWYAAANLSRKAVGLLLLPIFADTTYLAMREYGHWSLIESAQTLIVAVLGLRLAGGVIRFCAERETHDEAAATAWWATVALALLPVIGGVVVEELVPLGGLARWLGALLAAELCLSIVLAHLRAVERAASFAGLLVARSSVFIALVWLFVVERALGLCGVVAAAASSSAVVVVAGLALPASRALLRPRVSATMLRRLLRFSAPLVVESASDAALTSADRYLVALVAGAEAVALYALAGRVVGLLRMVVVLPLKRALWPVLFRVDESERPSLVASYVLTMVAGLSLAGVLLCAFTGQALSLAGADAAYQAALPLLPWLAFSTVLHGAAGGFRAVLALRERNATATAWFTVGVAVHAALTLALAAALGPLGASLAAALSASVILVGQALPATKLLPLALPASSLLLLGGGSLALSLALVHLDGGLDGGLAIGGASVVAWGALCWALAGKRLRSSWRASRG